jgi:hypothetical protein
MLSRIFVKKIKYKSLSTLSPNQNIYVENRLQQSPVDQKLDISLQFFCWRVAKNIWRIVEDGASISVTERYSFST